MKTVSLKFQSLIFSHRRRGLTFWNFLDNLNQVTKLTQVDGNFVERLNNFLSTAKKNLSELSKLSNQTISHQYFNHQNLFNRKNFSLKKKEKRWIIYANDFLREAWKCFIQMRHVSFACHQQTFDKNLKVLWINILILCH